MEAYCGISDVGSQTCRRRSGHHRHSVRLHLSTSRDGCNQFRTMSGFDAAFASLLSFPGSAQSIPFVDGWAAAGPRPGFEPKSSLQQAVLIRNRQSFQIHPDIRIKPL